MVSPPPGIHFKAMIVNTLNLLMVDDSDFIRERLLLLLAELKSIGGTKTAKSAEEGMQLLHEGYKPDIILLDINLPGKNGLQMLKDIRKMEDFSPIVIILTNNTVSGYKAECLRHGANYFLDKARDFQQIPSIIETTRQKLYPKQVL